VKKFKIFFVASITAKKNTIAYIVPKIPLSMAMKDKISLFG